MIWFLKQWKGISQNMDSINYEDLKNRIHKYLQKNLKESRYQHTLNVAQLAVKMAEREGVSREKAEIASLLHDMARNLPVDEMNRMAGELGLPDRYRDNPNLVHSKLAADMAKREFGIEDEDMLNAILYHTTGRPGMSTLEKIVFLADAIEPGRKYPHVHEIRKKAETDLNKACLESLAGTVNFIKDKGVFIDPDTLAAKEYFEKMEED